MFPFNSMAKAPKSIINKGVYIQKNFFFFFFLRGQNLFVLLVASTMQKRVYMIVFHV